MRPTLPATWIDRVLTDAEPQDEGGLLVAVSFVTLVAMLVVAGLAFAAITLLYTL